MSGHTSAYDYDTVDVLDTIYEVTVAFFVILGGSCATLGYLERPLASQRDSARSRQVYVCAALLCESSSLIAHSVSSVFRISTNVPSSDQGKVWVGGISRSSECLQYTSCVVMCWQWALLCSRILNWDSNKLRQFGYVLAFGATFFAAFYVGTTPISYGSAANSGGAVGRFNKYDDLITSCEFFLS